LVDPFRAGSKQPALRRPSEPNTPPPTPPPNLMNRLIDSFLDPAANKAIRDMSPEEYRQTLARYHQDLRQRERHLETTQNRFSPIPYLEQMRQWVDAHLFFERKNDP